MRVGVIWIWVLIFVMGCATRPKPAAAPPPAEDARLAIRNQGYSLLYGLMADEKNLSKILLIKKEQSDVGDLIKKISRVAGETSSDKARAVGRLSPESFRTPQYHLARSGG